MKIEFDDDFWYSSDDDTSRVFQVFPSVFGDERGMFTEAWKAVASEEQGQFKTIPPWFFREGWIRQINTSYSRAGVIRGCHAQRGASCQAKLVWSLNGSIWDVITDARPCSKTFMLTKVYFLNPRLQNKVFVPRGFLHAFITGTEIRDSGKYIFGYMCDNTYDRDGEICVSPLDIVIPAFYDYCDRYGVENFIKNGVTPLTSPKDEKGQSPDEFFSAMKGEYADGSRLWYR